jgi:putative ABC transport system permease protein
MILSDIKYAFRLLLKKPGFSILTILVMAFGIGLSVVLFSFLNTMLFKDLPFSDGEAIVRIDGSENGIESSDLISLSDFYQIRNNVQGLVEYGSYVNRNLNVTARDGSRRYSGVAAEENIFHITRTKPVIGREFSESDTYPGSEPVVVIGHDMWVSRFGQDKSVIDKRITINEKSHRIIGVMPIGYSFPMIAEMWLPLKQDGMSVARENAENVRGYARISGNTSKENIDQQINGVMQRLSERYPNTNTGKSAYLDTFQMAGFGQGISVINSMKIVAILILILSAVNVGNLMLSRAIERGKETAIRVALGAPQLRLVIQTLWESAIICITGGIIGLLIISLGLNFAETQTSSFSFDKPPFWWIFEIDTYTLTLFAIFVFFTILLTGLFPAWKNSGNDFNAVLRDGTRGATGKQVGKLNKILVIGEIFVAIAVLIAASVITFATVKSTDADYGADTSNKLISKLNLSETGYDTDEKKIQFVQTLEANLATKSSIGNVMISTSLPGNFSPQPNFVIENREYDTKNNLSYPRANSIIVTIGTIEKLGIKLIDGRYFNSVDRGLGKTTVVVSSSFVSRYFPDDSAIGKRIRFIDSEDKILEWLTIVGVVGHTIQGTPLDDSGKPPSIFRPYSQAPQSQLTLAISMQSDKSIVTEDLRKTLLSLDPNLPAFQVETYDDSLKRNIAGLRFGSIIFLSFGIAAVFLSASGIYGVMSNTIQSKTQEIGIKQALGASDKRIMNELLRIGIKQLLWGGIPGAIVGSAMGFGMSQLFGIDNSSLLIITLVIITIIGSISMLATYIPARKVLRLEPSDALRYE